MVMCVFSVEYMHLRGKLALYNNQGLKQISQNSAAQIFMHIHVSFLIVNLNFCMLDPYIYTIINTIKQIVTYHD